jgi:hypothetical protein
MTHPTGLLDSQGGNGKPSDPGTSAQQGADVPVGCLPELQQAPRCLALLNHSTIQTHGGYLPVLLLVTLACGRLPPWSYLLLPLHPKMVASTAQSVPISVPRVSKYVPGELVPCTLPVTIGVQLTMYFHMTLSATNTLPMYLLCTRLTSYERPYFFLCSKSCNAKQVQQNPRCWLIVRTTLAEMQQRHRC